MTVSRNRSHEDDLYILTRDGSQVEIVSDHLLELMVYRALLELKAQVMAQVFVDDFSLKNNKQEKLLKIKQDLATRIAFHWFKCFKKKKATERVGLSTTI